MKNKEIKNLNMPALRAAETEEANSNGYPLYPVNEDIYNQSKEEANIDPENITGVKAPNVKGGNNEKSFKEDISGSDLDIPGSEDDDEAEKIGSEDEENNYYSLGGDTLNSLEEDHGE